jgi:hypothetical protein
MCSLQYRYFIGAISFLFNVGSVIGLHPPRTKKTLAKTDEQKVLQQEVLP